MTVVLLLCAAVIAAPGVAGLVEGQEWLARVAGVGDVDLLQVFVGFLLDLLMGDASFSSRNLAVIVGLVPMIFAQVTRLVHVLAHLAAGHMHEI